MKPIITTLLQQALKTLEQENFLILSEDFVPKIEATRDPLHGDYASNCALILAKQAQLAPRELAQHIINALPASNAIQRVEIAGAGFINFFVNSDVAAQVIEKILSEKETYGHATTNAGQIAMVEFVSANPTGPLHVGHGRGAAVGDCIARLLSACGYQVTREFYYNDAGAQITHLQNSVIARINGLKPGDPQWPADAYHGEYIQDIAKAYVQGEQVIADDREITASGDIEDANAIKEFAVAYLRREQDLDLRAFDVQFDSYFLESSLYSDHLVESAVQQLTDNGYTYESDGALWLKTMQFGDDKDRVMRKSNGEYTYFIPDIAYHLNKWQRGYLTCVDEMGADHHSQLNRVRAGLQALKVGIPQHWPEYVLHQMVTVMRAGEEVKLSKRAGSYFTLRDLIDEVGRDATRYFLIARRVDSHLNFDIDLARAQSNENPVYYLQYAHARLCRVLERAEAENCVFNAELFSDQTLLLDHEQERLLLKLLNAFPETVKRASLEREPHQIAQYLQELAAAYHSYYNAVRVMVDEAPLRNARLGLSLAIRQVLRNALALIGVSAPEQM